MDTENYRERAETLCKVVEMQEKRITELEKYISYNAKIKLSMGEQLHVLEREILLKQLGV